VAEEGGFIYDADDYSDDLPFWSKQVATPHLVVPYTLDTNDMRFATAQGFHTGDQFASYLIDAFDTLYTEGATSPKMMSVGLHCRLIGRPARFAGLVKFIDHVQKYEKVWMARRLDIAKHWIKTHPYPWT
jgi:peptidoglycan/xylan/chitin deacetylase (PgdA/CDA1 family)